MKTIALILFFIIICSANWQEHYFRAIWDCDDEQCFIDSCEPGFADCNSKSIDGCEVNINNEIYNCGGCNNICSTPINGMPNCVLGICSIGFCNAPYADCNINSLDGCETNLDTNIDNCGSCGVMCPIPINGIRNCIAGKCSIEACATGYADCDHNLNNGCEINLQIDSNNCGQCGNKCLNCINGKCETQCNVEQILCNGICTLSDVNNCGKCGNICSGNTPFCSGIGANAECIKTSDQYIDYGCVSTTPLLGTLSSSKVVSYGIPFTSNTCYDFCHNAILALSFFTLSVDTSSMGVNIICECYTGTLNNPAKISECINGHGITYNGDGSVEVYTINPNP
jgi:hypothetical protein